MSLCFVVLFFIYMKGVEEIIFFYELVSEFCLGRGLFLFVKMFRKVV